MVLGIRYMFIIKNEISKFSGMDLIFTVQNTKKGIARKYFDKLSCDDQPNDAEKYFMGNKYIFELLT